MQMNKSYLYLPDCHNNQIKKKHLLKNSKLYCSKNTKWLLNYVH